ncbi:class I SAM-dependent methyltransferase [candidate division KSB1 bacterium]
MDSAKNNIRSILNSQKTKWEAVFSEWKDIFGKDPSIPGIEAAEYYSKHGFSKILELGCGSGRDTIYFARKGFRVDACDYSGKALKLLEKELDKQNLSSLVKLHKLDFNKPLPFDSNCFDACFSHMLYCMAFDDDDLKILSKNIHKVLKPEGINIYTVRNNNDPHFGKGKHIKDDIYEYEGFIVHFFAKDKTGLLSEGFENLDISQFEEGKLPRKLYLVIQKKVVT